MPAISRVEEARWRPRSRFRIETESHGKIGMREIDRLPDVRGFGLRVQRRRLRFPGISTVQAARQQAHFAAASIEGMVRLLSLKIARAKAHQNLVDRKS